MYMPPAFRCDDEAVAFEIIERYSFGTLVGRANGGLFATHLPFLLDREQRTLFGHIARANPQVESLTSGEELLAIFEGPHAYISPTEYVVRPAVPTWNYVAVHVTGPVRVLQEPQELTARIDALVQRYEATRPQPWSGELPELLRSQLLSQIVGFEIVWSRLECKLKLSQNRPEADRRQLRQRWSAGSPVEQSLCDWLDRAQ